MSRRTARAPQPATMAASVAPVSGNTGSVPASLAGSAAVFKPHRRSNPQTDRNSIAKAWQIEVYRHVNICGEARYAATLFAAMAGRAELGISEPQALRNKASWIKDGPEVEALADLCPTVRERTKLIRDYMLHRTIAGECYLIARKKVDTDPGFIEPPMDPMTDKPYRTWDEYLRIANSDIDLFDADFDGEAEEDPNVPIWEIVAVTELQKSGGDNETWTVRHDNGNYLTLSEDDPVIRLWNPDPQDRREAWSPFRSLLPTLREIEWLTQHIFTQVRSRLMSAGVWFLPDNMTFPPPPSEAVEGGAEAIAQMNEAEQFMLSLAASSMNMLDGDEVSFPSVVLADPIALAAIDQNKLIKFWSEIDDKAMLLRSDAVRRFALGMDMPPEQILGSSGLAVSGSGGSAGSVNHWGVWANEEQTISAHIEPALDDFVGALTAGFLRLAVENSTKVVAYDTAALRMRQDRSKEAMQWYDRGVLKAKVALKETGFDPENDMMDPEEHKMWLLSKLVSGSPLPEQMQAALALLGVVLPGVSGNSDKPKEIAGRDKPRSLEEHPYEGPPREQHDHTDAPFSAQAASAEVLVLRALEKAGNILLNSGKRGRDKDRSTPAHMAHVLANVETVPEFDFSLASTVYGDLTAAQRAEKERQLTGLCADLYREGQPYTREALIAAVGEA